MGGYVGVKGVMGVMSRVVHESSQTELTFVCALVRLQTEPSGAAHLKLSLKSSEHFPSSKYSEQPSSEVRAFRTTVSPGAQLLRGRGGGGGERVAHPPNFSLSSVIYVVFV
ncbi:hypothetical protein Hanom_Chr06g00573701 [Helianthus anomalus]